MISWIKKGFSARAATRHFIFQRLSAVILVPLIIWLVISIAMVPNASYAEIVDWVKHPLNFLTLLLLIVFGFYHAALGLEVIFEDYVSTQPLQKRLILISNILCTVFALLALYALISVSL